MAIKPDQTVNPVELQTKIGLALANGGVYAVETTKDIYITEVTENVTRATVNNVVNNPSGTLGGEIQLFDGKGFSSTSNLRYTDALGLYLASNLTMTGNINLTGSINSTGLLNLGAPSMVTIAGGNPGDVLKTDGAGNLAWVSAAGATYSNANVAAFLPTNTANIQAGNASLGNLVTATFYTGTLTTNAQPNITSVGTLTTLTVAGATTTGPQAVNGTITATGNIVGSNVSTAGNISGLNLTINNINSSGNITVSKSVIAANVTATHFGDGGNLTNINGANINGIVANAAHAIISDSANSVDGANVTGIVANAAFATVAAGALTVPGSGVTGTVASATVAASANTVAGANVTGQVPFAAVANSVAGANVTGQVGFAAVANSVAGANVSGQVAFAGTANAVAGANVSGQVANALVAGTVYTNAQPNITSVGSLTGLTVNGISNFYGTTTFNAVTNLGHVSNVTLEGGVLGQVLATDGAGHLSWINSAASLQPGGPVSSVQFNDGGVFGGITSFNVNKATGKVSIANLAVTGNVTTNLLPDANVTYDLGSPTQRWRDLWLSNTTIHMGPQSISATAGNITFSGNVKAAYFYGNATYASAANTANIATVANSVAGANVTGQVAFAGTANAVAGANVSGQVAFAAVANSVSVANIVGSIVADSVSGANVVGAVAFATVANSVAGANVSGQVAFAATANSVAAANVVGIVANAVYAVRASEAEQIDGAYVYGEVHFAATANAVAGANVAGAVALATAATTAGTVTTNAQPNITSVGTLTDLTVSGTTDLGDSVTPGGTFMTLDSTGVRLGQTGGQVIAVTGAGGINIAGTGGVTIQGVLGSNIDIGGGTGGNINVSSPLVVPVGSLKVSGGNPGEVLSTDGSGGLSWTAAALANRIESGTSSVDVPVADGNVVVTAGANAWNFSTTGSLVVPGAVYTASSPVSVRGDYGFIVHPSHNTGGTGPELAISYNDGIEITPLTNDYLAGGTTAAPMYIQGAYSTTSTVVPGSVFITPGRNTVDATYGNVVIGQNGGGIVKLLGDQIRLGAVNKLSIDGGNPGDVLTTDSFSGLSWQPAAATYGNADVANYLPTYTGNVGAGNLVLTGTTSYIESAGTIAILPAVGQTVDMGNTRLLFDITPVNAQGGNVGTSVLPFFEGHFVNVFGDTFTGEAGNLSNIQGANVVGNVTSAITANFANYAGNITEAAQPNITSVGILTSLETTGDITVGGNLIVNGTTTTVNSTTVDIGDTNITLAANATTAAMANGGGITLAGAGATIIYTSADDSWNVNKPIIGNLVGDATTANYAAYAGNVTEAAQANITSVGTLTALDVTGDISTQSNLAVTGGIQAFDASLVDLYVTGLAQLSDVTNVKIPGGTPGQLLQTDGTGNLAWTTVSANTIVNGTTQVSIPTLNGNVVMTVGGTQYTISSTAIGVTQSASPAPSLSGFSTANVENLIASKTANLGNVANVKLLGGTLGQVLATDGTGNLSWTTSTSTTLKYTREFHVDATLGNDTTGDGSYNKPYATIMKAHSLITSGAAVFLHLGTYTENVTWTKTNTDIIGLSQGGAVYCTGTWIVGTTSPASVRLTDISFNGTFQQNGTGRVLFRRCQVNGAFSKTSGEYLQAIDTDFSTSVSITSAGQVVIKGAQTNFLTVNHASAIVNISGLISGAVFVNTLGTLLVNDCIVYSATATTPAISSAAGSVTYIYGSSTATPTGVTARISMAGFWTTASSRYDTANSTLTGTNLGTISYFDAITTVGNVRAGNMISLGTVTATGNVAGGNITTGAQVVATGNVTGGNLRTAGALSVTGNANIGNIGTVALIATGNITGANITATGVFTGNGSGLTNIAGANMSNFAGNVTVAAQPNITSVGTLTTLAVAGNITGGNIAITANISASNIALNGQIVTPNITVTNRANLGAVGNVRITGGNATEFLTTDGLGSLSWASPLPQIGPDVTANLDFYPLFALANTGPLAEVYTSAAGFRYNPNTGTLTTGGLEMSNIQANVGNITVVNSSTVNAGTLNGSTVNGTNVVTPTVTAKTAAIEIKSLGVGDIKFTTVTGNVTMTNPTLFKNLLDPDQPQDAATKHYTDAIAQGLDPLLNARVATTGTLASITGGTVTYDNGVAGVGATLTLSQALTTLDGVTLANGNRILVHLEADAATNGVYVRTSATVLTRATDNDDNTKLIKGNFIFMAEGTLYGKVGFTQTEVISTVGTDPTTWVQFAAAPDYVAGAGIYITGAEIKIDNTGVTAGSYGGSGAIPVLNINSRGQITSASVSGISAPAGGLTGNRIHSNVFYSNLQTVGTLENLTVSGDSTLAGNIFSFGNVTVGNADLGNLAVANFFQGDGGLLTNLQISLNKIDNGTSELIVDPNAAVRAVINGNPVSSTTSAGLEITGAITATTSVSADTVVATTSVTAPDFIGVASSANTANTATQVIDATQANITTVGTLTSLDVAGITTLGAVANVKITGGTNGQMLRTDGTGNLVWATATAATAATVTTNAQPNITSVGTLTTLAVTGNISGANITGAHYGAGNNLSNIQAANITGQVANAIVSGTVYTAAQPNITSVGTLTSLVVSGTTQLGDVGNLTITGGTSGQVLASNGSGGLTWSTLPVAPVFPTLPNYADDAAANAALGTTPSLGMMYFDTTLEAVKVYKTLGWMAL